MKYFIEYNPPEPPKGATHRYLQAVFEHAEPLNVAGINQRCAFDIDLFTLTYELHPTPDAFNFYKTTTQ